MSFSRCSEAKCLEELREIRRTGGIFAKGQIVIEINEFSSNFFGNLLTFCKK